MYIPYRHDNARSRCFRIDRTGALFDFPGTVSFAWLKPTNQDNHSSKQPKVTVRDVLLIFHSMREV